MEEGRPVIPCKKVGVHLIFLVPCPYCGQRHRHGAGSGPPWEGGHRAADCSDIKIGKGKKAEWVPPPGKERGYVLEVVGGADTNGPGENGPGRRGLAARVDKRA